MAVAQEAYADKILEGKRNKLNEYVDESNKPIVPRYSF